MPPVLWHNRTHSELDVLCCTAHNEHRNRDTALQTQFSSACIVSIGDS